MHIYSTCTEYTIHVNSNTIHGLTAIDKHLHKLVKHQSINRSNGVNLGDLTQRLNLFDLIT